MILLFYKYIWIEYPLQIQKWQRRLSVSLGLTGRIIIAQEGINGTVGGTDTAIYQYTEAVSQHPLFSAIDFKKSVGSAADFPKLSVVIKKEIVHLNIDPATLPASEGGTHISPEQAHQLLQERSNDFVVLDARNAYESRIGAFTGAITPDIQNFREFPQYVDAHIDTFRGKRVLLYCTGGVRCERASAYLKRTGAAAEVMQLTGGIHMYAEQYPDGFFRGKNYVFDERIAIPVNEDVIGRCEYCHIPYDTYRSCVRSSCNKQLIICPPCLAQQGGVCTTVCRS